MNGDLSTPVPDSQGLYEPVFGRAPQSWPWALPHLYAANAAALRCEVVGYWGGRFHVLNSERFDHPDRARAAARYTFESLPVRLLMDRGRIREENTSVEITGAWPERWVFVRLQDLGVLCAYLYESAVAGGAGERAERFRSLVYFASPPTEQLIVYQNALKEGRELLGPCLPESALAALRIGLKAAKKWLR